MRVLICGDRDWTDQDAVYAAVFDRRPEIETVISGHARGADTCGEIAAHAFNIPLLIFPANWKDHGKAAGPIRNQQMLDEGKPDEVWAFHADLENSKGTRDMVKRAKKAGVLVRRFPDEEAISG